MWMLLSVALAAPADEESVRDGMAAHWTAAESARDAVIAGNAEFARRVARAWLDREAPDDPLLRDARDRLKGPFTQIADAKTVAEAGVGVGALAGACGACHAEARTDRSYEPPTPPKSKSAMQHHRAGAEFMWAGLIANSRPLFEAGASTLASGNLAVDGLPSGTELERTAGELEMQVQDTAARARRSKDPAEQARLYGKMLGTCATCHQLTHGGPGDAGLAKVPGDAPLVSEMHERFATLAKARAAVEKGDLEAAKAEGTALLDLPPPTGLPLRPWRPWVVDVRARAAELAEAKTVYDAAVATARVASSCGACHTAVEAGPAVPRREDLEGTPGDGADLMWLALLTESNEAWTLGAELAGRADIAETPAGDARARAFARFVTPSH
ncbi:MAG: hypothetical protein H6737_09485 [Alphaproteobacteria bacterium]|nr:hypothetical protein [Alphaproteobacteria bacterium]